MMSIQSDKSKMQHREKVEIFFYFFLMNTKTFGQVQYFCVTQDRLLQLMKFKRQSAFKILGYNANENLIKLEKNINQTFKRECAMRYSTQKQLELGGGAYPQVRFAFITYNADTCTALALL